MTIEELEKEFGIDEQEIMIAISKYSRTKKSRKQIEGVNQKVHNSRVSYKGKDIVLDYDHILHRYDFIDYDKNEMKKVVPVEMFPYEGDVRVEYIKVDEEFGVVDLDELIKWADKMIVCECKELCND